ncbi:hypothetical protein SAMN05421788_10357 [Filimonas lacunae]|uniref:Uncharacterized protein n=1 Tax=Filimonas lacunae TaxID=477680 RepID=A0A173MJY1_9BACT|nr:hypothetical protein [Filimonas lacunae]BAV07708.1 hypothetical protein FLA_3739 [Filimonas lacunae]SIT03825.1 hypothetical protein SAMN05421788_10357 [Filimonas lacunae]
MTPFKSIIYCLAIVIATLPTRLFSQSNCKCLTIKKECIKYCLGLANASSYAQNILKLDVKTANEISKVPNRDKLKSVADYQSQISRDAYKKLDSLYKSIPGSGTTVENNGQVHNQAIGDNNTIIQGDYIVTTPIASSKPEVRNENKPENTKSLNRLPLTDYFEGIKTTVTSCVLRNNKLTCHLTFEYVGQYDKINIEVKKGDTKVSVDGGNIFTNTGWTIANKSIQGFWMNYQLLRMVPVEASIEFNNVGIPVTTINFLPIVKDAGFSNIPVSMQ